MEKESRQLHPWKPQSQDGRRWLSPLLPTRHQEAYSPTINPNKNPLPQQWSEFTPVDHMRSPPPIFPFQTPTSPEYLDEVSSKTPVMANFIQVHKPCLRDPGHFPRGINTIFSQLNGLTPIKILPAPTSAQLSFLLPSPAWCAMSLTTLRERSRHGQQVTTVLSSMQWWGRWWTETLLHSHKVLCTPLDTCWVYDLISMLISFPSSKHPYVIFLWLWDWAKGRADAHQKWWVNSSFIECICNVYRPVTFLLFNEATLLCISLYLLNVTSFLVLWSSHHKTVFLGHALMLASISISILISGNTKSIHNQCVYF